MRISIFKASNGFLVYFPKKKTILSTTLTKIHLHQGHFPLLLDYEMRRISSRKEKPHVNYENKIVFHC